MGHGASLVNLDRYHRKDPYNNEIFWLGNGEKVWYQSTVIRGSGKDSEGSEEPSWTLSKAKQVLKIMDADDLKIPEVDWPRALMYQKLDASNMPIEDTTTGEDA